MNSYQINKLKLQYQTDLKNAVDLLIDCVSDEYKKEILDKYKTEVRIILGS